MMRFDPTFSVAAGVFLIVFLYVERAQMDAFFALLRVGKDGEVTASGAKGPRPRPRGMPQLRPL